MMKSYLIKNQIIPLLLTVVVFVLLVGLLWLEVIVLNNFSASDIILQVRTVDILVGLTIYLKTSIDFAIFIAHMMDQYKGWKGRIAIEVGTALGNALGTLVILLIWNFFREVEWLLALMIFVAALVLFRLAEDGLEHAKVEESQKNGLFFKIVTHFEYGLAYVNKVVKPLLRYIIPNISMKPKSGLGFLGLIAFAFTVPFILGLDDFAGYVPLFNVVNVFGFAIGVFAGHMILNAFLYISPTYTIKIVKNPIISFLGSVAFVALAFWGIYEVVHILIK